jgi:hypothetical protein
MASRLLSRLSYANVVATLALFIALGGGAYAAITVTGKNVRNGSLTGADLKNNSVASTDVRNGSLLSKDFKAGQLKAGPAGPRGATGVTGPVGPSQAFHAAGTQFSVTAANLTDILTPLQVPAGSYAAVARVRLAANATTNLASCRLFVGSSLDDSQGSFGPPPVTGVPPETTLTMTTTGTLAAPGPISVSCGVPSGTGAYQVVSSSVTAIKVGSLGN